MVLQNFFFFGLKIFFIQFLKVTVHLQLLQNTGYIPCVVQYIFVAYFMPNSLHLWLPYLDLGSPDW